MSKMGTHLAKGLVLSLIASLLTILQIAPASAALNVGTIFGNYQSSTGGGGLVDPKCPTNGVLTGISGQATDYEVTGTYKSTITQLKGACATLNSDGATIASVADAALGPYGSTAGTSLTDANCATSGGNQVIVGARLYKTSTNSFAGGVTLLCGTLPLGGSRTYGATLGNAAGSYEDIACATGSVAVGLYVNYGGIVDRFGISCAPIVNIPQSITFNSIGSAPKTWNSFSTTATSSSGLTVTLSSSTTSICTVSGFVITLVAAGSCTITANQSGSTNFVAASSVTQTFQILAGAPAITTSDYDGDGPGVGWPIHVSNLGGETVTVTGTNLATCTQLVAAGGGWTGPLDLTNVSDTNFTFVVPAPSTFYGWIRANCGGRNFDFSASVQRFAVPANTVLPVISGTLRPGQLLSATNGSWTASPTSYRYQWSRSSTSNGTYTSIAGADTNTYTLTAGDTTYYIKITVTARTLGTSASATSIASAQVALTSQSITLSSLGTNSKTYPYSQTLSMTTSGASGTGAITFSIASGGTATSCALSDTSSAATLTASTSGTCLIRAVIAADANYESATSTSVTFTFSRAGQSSLSITTTTGNYGTSLSLASSGGSSSSSVTYAYSPGTTTCTLSGSSLTAAAPGTCLVTATKALDDNYSAISSSQTTITFGYGVSTASVSIAAGTLVYRQAKSITAIGNVAGKITFRANNVVIAGCKNMTVNAGNSYTRSCSYRPTNRGFVTIKVTLIPTDSSFTNITSQMATLFVYNRSGARS